MRTIHGGVGRLLQSQNESRYSREGRFGRLFPNLPALGADLPGFGDLGVLQQALRELGKKSGVMDGSGTGPETNPDSTSGLPAGFTFLGQFIDHDITFDPTSSLERQNDPESIANFRTPTLELDNVYGSGPAASPHLYTRDGGKIKFLVDQNFPNDLPRNSVNTALIGDPRNDENFIISQLHLAFLKFHNAVTDRYASELGLGGEALFRRVQQDVRRHYQNLVVYDFLARLVDERLIDKIIQEGPRYYRPRVEPFIPVEFSVAAYRFGHSMVRDRYSINAERPGVPLFDPTADPANPTDLRGGFRPTAPDPNRIVQWSFFFEFDGSRRPQKGKRLDRKLSGSLFNLFFLNDPDPERNSLAVRNLLRGLAFNLPTGQSIARAIGAKELRPEDFEHVGFGPKAHAARFMEETPLWFYILHEADVLGDQGRRLGPVGATIVAEVFLGLLHYDRMSYLRQWPQWTPRDNRPQLIDREVFRMTDLITIAGMTL